MTAPPAAPGRRRDDRLGGRQAGVVLPVRVRAWDGSDAGPPAAPTVVLRSPLALRHGEQAPGVHADDARLTPSCVPAAPGRRPARREASG